LDKISDPTLKEMWREIVGMRQPYMYHQQVGSSVRRLLRLARNSQSRRSFGLPLNALDFTRWMTEGWLVVIDTSPWGDFYQESALLPTNVILHGVYQAAMSLPEPLEVPWFVTIDEAQEYLTYTPIIKDMLDRIAWSNVHLELFFQQTGQVQKAGQEWLFGSILNYCPVKFAWAGLHPQTAAVLAEHMFSDVTASMRAFAHRISDAPWQTFWYSRPQAPTVLVYPKPFVSRRMTQALTERRILEEFVLPFGPLDPKAVDVELAERRRRIDAEAWKRWRQHHPKEPGKSPGKPSGKPHQKPVPPSLPRGPDSEDEEGLSYRSKA